MFMIASRLCCNRPRSGTWARSDAGWLSLLVALASLGSTPSAPAEEAARIRDVEAIRAAAKAYQEALDRGDRAALAALWTPDGDIVDDAGNVMPGRETVSLASGPVGEGERPECRVRETSLRFLCPDAAVEDGTVEVVVPGGSPLEGRFSATWVRHDGAWKLAALRESRLPGAEGAEALQELDWMVGDWIVVDETGALAGDHLAGGHLKGSDAVRPIEVTARWNPERTFLIREMRFPMPDARSEPLVVSQHIGWDPLSRRIRAWAFGSDGSHGEATLDREGGTWIARTTAVRPDGNQTASINLYDYDGKDRCVCRSVATHVGSEHVPHVVMTMIRKPGSTTP
jgi:uncharacterized protein (TIGR02246 family)